MTYKNKEALKEWQTKNADRIRNQQREYRRLNAKRLKEYARAYRLATPEKQRAQARKCQLAKYNLTPEQYETLLFSQDKKCAICNSANYGLKVSRRLAVDHDHSSGKVRGILCFNCNSGLARFEDDPLRLELAARYLRENAR